MSDPQDLLYTNQFISTDILSDKELEKETEYYDRFKNYIDNGSADEIKKYIDKDLYESDPVNINRILHKKWPLNGNKNHYPLFDTYINDISTDRYKKEIVTKINVDSKNRDISNYFNPNSFTISLNKVFTNIKKYVINDINFQNINQSITNVNNNLAWQYPSQNYLAENNIDNSIYPVPLTTSIYFSSLPNSVYSYTNTTSSNSSIDNYLVYQTNVSPGFYTIDNLINKIRLSTSTVLHGENANIGIKIIEQPYLSYVKRIGTPHLFSCEIDPITSIVRFVNRIEEVSISAIQTFSPYETNFQDNDIFYFFSSQYSPNENGYALNTELIYIILPVINDITDQYYYNINCIYTPNPFPLVITDLKTTIGNIDPELINYTEFYDVNIYTSVGYKEVELNSISYYKFIDTITVNTQTQVFNLDTDTNVTTNFTKKYVRFGLHLSNGNINGNTYNKNGQSIQPSLTDNILFSPSLQHFFSNYGNVQVPLQLLTTTTNKSYYSYYTSGVLTEYKFIDKAPLLGRALLFRWIFDKNNGNYINYEIETNNEKKRTLLHTLAWPIANETNQIFTLDTNNGYKFVHTNYQSLILNKKTVESFNYQQIINYPSINLNLQYFSNNYYFINNSYIYLKITFNSQNTETKDQYINAISNEDLQYNQVYVNNQFFNVGIGEDYTSISNCKFLDVYKKEQYGIFTKIMLSNIPGNYDIQTSNIINNNSYYINYDEETTNVSEITVELYDCNLKLLGISNNFSFTLEIHEIHDILKETLVNTKTNNVTTTGSFI